MSLNGLDDVKVKEAQDAAVAEPGGWFLLRYASRDEVDILQSGKGGIADMRNAIALYEEDSPLYGFLRYRRRSVVVKYVPEGCSRLVLARIKVHFIAVTERLAPYDTEFEITTAEELHETALSAACSLHTDVASSSSPSKELHKRLGEIEEGQEEAKTRSPPAESEERLSRPMTARPLTATSALSSHPPDIAPPAAPIPVLKRNDLETSPPPPRERDDPDQSSRRPSLETRKLSTSSSRPDVHVAYGRPQIKLAPRPSIEGSGISLGAGDAKAISSLPPGLKLLSRKKSSDRPQSHMPSNFSPPPVPENLNQEFGMIRPHTSAGRPTTSSGASIMSTRSAYVAKSGPPKEKSPTMTPEKARLMKALQMRKSRQGQATPPPTSPLPPLPNSTSPTSRSVESSLTVVPDVNSDTLRMLKIMAEANVAMGINELHDAESDATRTISTPASPSTSERAASTQASSISDSTDETVREARNDDDFDDLASKDTSVFKNEIENTPALTVPGTLVSNVSTTEIKENERPYTPLSKSPVIPQSILGDHSPSLPAIRPQSVFMLEPSATVRELSAPATAKADPIMESIVEEKRAPTPKIQSPIGPDAMKHILQAEMSTKGTLLDLPKIDPSSVALPHSPTAEITFQSLHIPATSSVDATKVKELDTPIIVLNPHVPKPMTPSDGSSGTARNLPHPMITRTPPRETTTPITPTFSTGDPPETTQTHPTDTTSPEIKETELAGDPTAAGTTAHRKKSIDDTDRTSVLYFPGKKNRASLSLINIDVEAAEQSGHNTDGESLSDDEDLMEELHTASVQEARPMRVSKSPIRPYFSKMSPKKSPAKDYPKTSPKKSPGKENRFSRTLGSRYGDDKRNILRPLSGHGDVLRSSSATSTYLKRLSVTQQSPSLTKNVNVGSSISQRIKALQQNLGPETTIAAAAPAQNASPAFFSVKRTSLRASGRNTPNLEKAMIDNILVQRNSPSPSDSNRNTSLERSGSTASRRSNLAASSPVLGPAAGIESISVTARIVRDADQSFHPNSGAGREAHEYRPLELRQSPLIIDHQKGGLPSSSSIAERRQSRDSGRESRDVKRSSTTIRDLLDSSRNSFSSNRHSMIVEPTQPLPTFARPESVHQYTQTSPLPEPQRPSSVMSRHSSLHDKKAPAPLNVHDLGFHTTSSSDDAGPSPSFAVDKKGNRASRIMSRMSNSLQAGRKTISQAMSPTLREEPDSESSPDTFQAQVSSATSAKPAERLPDLIKSLSNSDMVFSSTPIPVTISSIGDVNVQFPDTLLWKRRFVSLDSAGNILLSQSQSASAKLGNGEKKIHLSEFKTPFIPDEDCMEMPNSVVLEWMGTARQLQVACVGRGEQGRVLTALKDAHANWAAQGQ